MEGQDILAGSRLLLLKQQKTDGGQRYLQSVMSGLELLILLS